MRRTGHGKWAGGETARANKAKVGADLFLCVVPFWLLAHTLPSPPPRARTPPCRRPSRGRGNRSRRAAPCSAASSRAKLFQCGSSSSSRAEAEQQQQQECRPSGGARSARMSEQRRARGAPRGCGPRVTRVGPWRAALVVKVVRAVWAALLVVLVVYAHSPRFAFGQVTQPPTQD